MRTNPRWLVPACWGEAEKLKWFAEAGAVVKTTAHGVEVSFWGGGYGVHCRTFTEAFASGYPYVQMCRHMASVREELARKVEEARRSLRNCVDLAALGGVGCRTVERGDELLCEFDSEFARWLPRARDGRAA